MKDNVTELSGFQNGIADSPHLGIADMRNLNILSSVGTALVNFKMEQMNQPSSLSGVSFSADAATDVFTVASTAGYYTGMAVQINTLGATVGPSASKIYWIGDLTNVSFRLYKNPMLTASLLVNVTTGGSGTFSSYTMTAPLDKAVGSKNVTGGKRNYIFILDDSGQVWWVDNRGGVVSNNLIYLGNTTGIGTGQLGRAITVYKDYIIVFRSGDLDALRINAVEDDIDWITGFPSLGWIYGWESISGSQQARRAVLVGEDDVMYYDNSHRIASIAENVSQTFDPSSGATYTETVALQRVPRHESVLSLAELGEQLLIGGIEAIYPLNRTTNVFGIPIVAPEQKIFRMVTANNLTFIFAGTRGRIYVTNGSSVSLYKKIPDYISGVNEPYFQWGDAMAWKGQLYFSITATKNDGTALTSVAGAWAINIKTGALRLSNMPSYGTYAGSVTLLTPNILTDTPAGIGLYMGWSNSGSYGMDVSSTALYSNYEAYMESALFSVGSSLIKHTFNTIETQLVKSLTTGQGVRIWYRKNLSDTYTKVLTLDFATQGANLSHTTDALIADAEFVQLKAELTTTGDDNSPELRRVALP